MIRFIKTYRRFLVVGIQLSLIILSNFLAFWIRFEGEFEDKYLHMLIQMLPWLILIRGVTFIPFRLYHGLWRYTGIWDLGKIIAGVLTSTLLFSAVVRWGFELTGYPRSIFIIDTLLLIFFMGGMRLGRRLYRKRQSPHREKTVLIYGAGDAGEMIVRDMKNNDFYDHKPIGFIDDDPAKKGLSIHGVRVIGTGDALPQIMAQEAPDQVVVAIPRADPATLRKIVRRFEAFRVSMKALPSVHEVVDNAVDVSQIRDLCVEDLLTRPKVTLDMTPVLQFVHGKRVLVTGAGGSIGSELCRQLVRCQPETLLLLDKAESALYDIDMELGQSRPDCLHVTLLADVKHSRRLATLFRAHRPQIIFHAAAYKHVPMMELNPDEAVFNNIIGTHRLSEVAIQHRVETFVLISTDKAVNPTNVMGATKRVCELSVQTVAQGRRCGQTVFCGVRFGNVLGSNGSVVPLFLRQIDAGGPVTVTDPAMRRYFMTIPEAAQLVLQASTLARGGEIFVLDMGEQIKVVELARHIIRLAGFVPEEEIPIAFTGLRPGEKLYEELVGTDEIVENSSVEKIQRVKPAWLPEPILLGQKIAQLERFAKEGDAAAILVLLHDIVPTFRNAEFCDWRAKNQHTAQSQKNWVDTDAEKEKDNGRCS